MKTLDTNSKLARRRRQFSSEQVAERANISRSTLWLVEKGDAGVAMGTYLQVLFVLGLEKDFQSIPTDDSFFQEIGCHYCEKI